MTLATVTRGLFPLCLIVIGARRAARPRRIAVVLTTLSRLFVIAMLICHVNPPVAVAARETISN
jgi:hypothetical protein